MRERHALLSAFWSDPLEYALPFGLHRDLKNDPNVLGHVVQHCLVLAFTP